MPQQQHLPDYPCHQPTEPEQCSQSSAAWHDLYGNGFRQGQLDDPTHVSGDPQAPPGAGYDLFTPREAFNDPGEPVPEPIEGGRWVHVVHGEDDPLVMEGSPSSEDALVLESAPHGVDARFVDRTLGSLDAPLLLNHLADDALFIGGVPRPQDVDQGAVGDCYLLALLAGLAAADPGLLTDMLSLEPGSVTGRFYAEVDGDWRPVTVTVPTTLLYPLDDRGVPGADLLAAGFAVGETPLWSSWYAQVAGDTLWIARDDTYEAALWVPYVEKLYARYAERWGLYGRGTEHGEEGWAEIGDGGVELRVAPILTGIDPAASEVVVTRWSAHECHDIVEKNLKVLHVLASLDPFSEVQQRGAIAASGDAELHLERLGRAIGALPAEIRDSLPELLRAELDLLKGLLADYRSADDEASKAVLHDTITATALDVVYPDDISAPLHEPDAPLRLQALLELLLIVGSRSGAAGPQMGILDSHGYAVLDASLLDEAGLPVAWNPAQGDEVLLTVDPFVSQVTLMNPHHTNEPDPHGRGPADGVDDGRFDVSLDTFLRSFTHVTHMDASQ
ncbi:MAG: hypothetical protein H6739_14900 [Alphaproteobacteria bacterium]|nr:hypothetical protein [Alphaproteobacteria bacterium]